ncbi:MAG: oligosaccharide flippase family protein [Acidobacteriaceae bacterium]|nr:oligosaccharide flippase family protein [Acidobacteriaceae bacterium]
MVAVTALVCGMVIVGFSNWGAASIFHDKHARILILLLAAALPFECLFELAKSFLRARRLNRNWAILTLSRLLPEIVATVFIGWWLARVNPVAVTYLTCGILGAVSGVIYLIGYRGIRFVTPSKAVMKKYLGFGLPLIPGGLAYSLSVSADRYLVSYFLDLKQVGIYSVCFTISALAFFLVGPINDVLFPDLSALYDSGHPREFSERFSGIQKFVFGISVGAAALLAAFPADVLRLLSSRDFTSGSVTLAILGIQGIFMAIVMLYSVIFAVHLKVWSYSFFWIASGAVIVLLDVLLLPRMGIAGAAVSQLVATGGGAFVVIGMHWQLFRESFRSIWLLQNAIAFGAPFLVMALWPHTVQLGGLQSCLRLIAGSGMFILALVMTRYLRASDLKLFQAALLRRRGPVSTSRLG